MDFRLQVSGTLVEVTVLGPNTLPVATYVACVDGWGHQHQNIIVDTCSWQQSAHSFGTAVEPSCVKFSQRSSDNTFSQGTQLLTCKTKVVFWPCRKCNFSEERSAAAGATGTMASSRSAASRSAASARGLGASAWTPTLECIRTLTFGSSPGFSFFRGQNLRTNWWCFGCTWNSLTSPFQSQACWGIGTGRAAPSGMVRATQTHWHASSFLWEGCAQFFRLTRPGNLQFFRKHGHVHGTLSTSGNLQLESLVWSWISLAHMAFAGWANSRFSIGWCFGGSFWKISVGDFGFMQWHQAFNSSGCYSLTKFSRPRPYAKLACRHFRQCVCCHCPSCLYVHVHGYHHIASSAGTSATLDAKLCILLVF